MKQMQSSHYLTRGGIQIHRASVGIYGPQAIDDLRKKLDSSQGVLFSSSYDFPGRYSRWDLGFVAPPVRISSSARKVVCRALNARGEILLQIMQQTLQQHNDFYDFESTASEFACKVREPQPVLYEEDRSRQRSVFTVLRVLLDLFASPQDNYLGLYGAFGYELAFQFEAITQRLAREADAQEMVLYLPDSIVVVDHKRETAQQHFYDFTFTSAGEVLTTRDLPRRIVKEQFVPLTDSSSASSDHAPGVFAAVVRKALAAFSRGDMFEVVPGQTFSVPCNDQPSEIFHRLQQQNPAPYGALLNLGEQEFLVSASPEMYVRVEGQQVETCPISGTIARGSNALEDAEQIRTLLNSAKDEAELSMCTDVDRNDKSRVCVPGSVQVNGRRLIEMYSRLIHTVDHVTGVLKPQFDALDAFLSHAWAVTVTGAPKHAAIQFIEDHELSPRHWYGGAMGCLNFNGNLNSGLTIRTIRIKNGMAEIRAGATLLADSDPDAEEAETRLKASALLRAVQPDAATCAVNKGADSFMADTTAGTGMQILMVDHQDSFVHTLSAYLQQTGAQVRTVRPAAVADYLQEHSPDLVVLSPGPGRPVDFTLSQTIALILEQNIPVFGVCLGLQGIVEYFGGSLRVLAKVMHGKSSPLSMTRGPLFANIPTSVEVGRYHSLVADKLPDCLQVCAFSADGEIMAVQHKQLPVFAVQFHPESILTAQDNSGLRLLANLLRSIKSGSYAEMPA